MSFDSEECFWLVAKPKPVTVSTTETNSESPSVIEPQAPAIDTNTIHTDNVTNATNTTIDSAPTETSKPQRQKYPDEPMDFYAEVLILRNTPGSYAGAGSGQFHQYRMARRREMYRLGKMKADAAAEQERLDWEAARQSRVDKEEKKRAIKAKKRQKRKRKHPEEADGSKCQKVEVEPVKREEREAKQDDSSEEKVQN